ncbi:MAG: hypothetical protein ACR2JN_12625, partial [Lapillicoccus sp.]
YMTAEEIAAQQEQEAAERGTEQALVPATAAEAPDGEEPAWVPSAPEPPWVSAAPAEMEGEALTAPQPAAHEGQWGEDNGHAPQQGAAPESQRPGYGPPEGEPAHQPPPWGGPPQQWGEQQWGEQQAGQQWGRQQWQPDPIQLGPGEPLPQQWRQWPDPAPVPPAGAAPPASRPASGPEEPTGGEGTAYLLPQAGEPDSRPLAHDLMETRSRRDIHGRKATKGWRAALGNATGGLIAPGPGQAEQREQAAIHRIVRPAEGRKTIMVINTKGGGGKTLVTLMLAAYLGRYRTGNTLAWDNNETEGTLGMRAHYRPHNRTVVDLLNDLATLKDNPHAGPGLLARWVREQGAMKFDVLASADDDESMRVVGGSEFRELHEQLSRFYRVIVVDTGNNRLAPNWLAAVEEADELVFATSLKDDVAVVAAKNLDAIVAAGKADVIRNAVCVISHTLERSDPTAFQHTRNHFQQWVRAVVDVPYDPLLGPGLQLDPTRLKPVTHQAWLDVTAAVVDGL